MSEEMIIYKAKLAGEKFYRMKYFKAKVESGSTFTISLKCEPKNPYDSNAVEVYATLVSGECIKLGYVPRTHSATTTRLLHSKNVIPTANLNLSDNIITVGYFEKKEEKKGV